MGKITITGDSLRELTETLGALFAEVAGGQPADANPTPTQPEATDAPKARQTRKKAEAPAPIQPEDAAFGAAPAAPAEAPNPFAPAPAEAPAAFAPAPAAPAERPAVAKLKELLATLSAQHEDPQVYNWVIQKALGMSPSVTKDEFLSKIIYQQDDAALEAVYRQGGGKA